MKILIPNSENYSNKMMIPSSKKDDVMSEDKRKEAQFNKQILQSTGNVVVDPIKFERTRGDYGVKVCIACNDVYSGAGSKRAWYIDCIFLEECVDVAMKLQKGDFIRVKGILQPYEIKPLHRDKNTGEVIRDRDGIPKRSNASLMVTPDKRQGESTPVIPLKLLYRKPPEQLTQWEESVQWEEPMQIPEPEAPQQHISEQFNLQVPQEDYVLQQNLFHEEMEKRNTSKPSNKKVNSSNQRFYTRDVTRFNGNQKREATPEDVIAGQMSKAQFDQAINEVSV